MRRGTVTILGATRFAANMRGRKADVQGAVWKVVNDTAQRVFNESQRLVPVDTGNLKASGRFTPAERGASIVATIGYGGTAAGYALVVHEIHATRSKYLEKPAREETSRFIEDVRKALRGEL
jgi:hypothetical protein